LWPVSPAIPLLARDRAAAGTVLGVGLPAHGGHRPEPFPIICGVSASFLPLE
jgi:hypothetical protein